MMTTATHDEQYSAPEPILFVAFELRENTWKLGFTIGHGQKPRCRAGPEVGQAALEEMATVAKPDTILAWHRTFADQQCDRSQPHKSIGRPRIDKKIEDLVVWMARENRSWGMTALSAP